ncbi:unnamed protein product [Musa acuminata subsp. malaccensis]|uniref:(wild Malaysian banana) hypothetical protein n=1 Tax=Musa acuminata subsp. malaccensis TaxID=214687 RepID=A0A804JMV7_MUSAM|nr:unnamed protein product [Musa acuminata subsp. malaccensis]
MGYKENAAKRALRMTGQDVQPAVHFLVEELGKYSGNRRIFSDKERFCIALYFAREYCVRHLSDCSLVSRINTCTLLVNLFCSFDRDLAAQALRVNENEVQKALDLLTNPESPSESTWKLGVSDSSGADVEELVSMGYNRSSVVDAVQRSLTKEDVLKLPVGANSEDSQHATINQPKDD